MYHDPQRPLVPNTFGLAGLAKGSRTTTSFHENRAVCDVSRPGSRAREHTKKRIGGISLIGSLVGLRVFRLRRKEDRPNGSGKNGLAVCLGSPEKTVANAGEANLKYTQISYISQYYILGNLFCLQARSWCFHVSQVAGMSIYRAKSSRAGPFYLFDQKHPFYLVVTYCVSCYQGGCKIRSGGFAVSHLGPPFSRFTIFVS